MPGLPASGSTKPSVSSAARFLFNCGLGSPGIVDAGDADRASITVTAGEAGEAAEASCCVGDNGAELAAGVTFQNMELCGAMKARGLLHCRLETKG